MIAAWMAYEVAHAYELPEDEENKTERTETKSDKEGAE